MTSATKAASFMRSSLRSATAKLCAHFCRLGSLRVGTLALSVSRMSTASRYGSESSDSGSGAGFVFWDFFSGGFSGCASGPSGSDKETERSEVSLSSWEREERQGEERRGKVRKGLEAPVKSRSRVAFRVVGRRYNAVNVF